MVWNDLSTLGRLLVGDVHMLEIVPQRQRPSSIGASTFTVVGLAGVRSIADPASTAPAAA